MMDTCLRTGSRLAATHGLSASRRLLRPLGAYAAVVGIVAGAGTAMIATTPEYDASIGGAGLLLVVVLLGLPWSLSIFLADDGITGSLLSAVLYVACAVANGTVVLLIRARWRPRA
jgi:hypothetical protein